MNSLCIYCILVLQNYLTSFYSYPKEIIMLIISMIPNNNKISCGKYECTSFILNDTIYTCDKNNLVPTKQNFNEGNIDSICYGLNHTIFIEKSKKAIYSRGLNDYSQLGLGDFTNRTAPQKIMFDFKSKIMSVACGDDHTLVITELGEIYGWGGNYRGQLGLGDRMDRNVPHKLSILDIKSVSCGEQYTMILTKPGELFTCGDNTFGQLGLGNFRNQKSLQKIIIPETLFISCGKVHTMALTSNGIYSWGENCFGKLGLGNDISQCTPQKNNLLRSSITSCIIAISCGAEHTTILTKQGKLFGCGYNRDGQLGAGHNNYWVKFRKLNWNEFVLSVNCGRHHTIVTTRSRKYFGWGRNSYGQLGLGDTEDKYEPIEIRI